jgi:GT2 family glycosyltransferase
VHYDGGRFHYAGLYSLRNFGVPLERAEGRGVLAVDGAVSVALLADRDLVLAAGGFDPRFFILFEDLDLSYRLRLEGRTILSVEEALVRHRGGTPGISHRAPTGYPRQRTFLHSRNRWIFLLKNYRVATLLAALPGLLLYELAALVFALTSGHLGAYARGKLELLQGLGATLAARETIQQRRRLTDRELLVGGPLTLHASLGQRSLAAAGLDRGLSLWWRLAHALAG